MKNLLLFLSVTVFSVVAPVCVFAGEETAARSEHYAHAKFENSAQAQEALNAKISEIKDILDKSKELAFTDMEEIHEKSYTLESAVDKFREDKAADAGKIDSLDEAVQAIHFASENQEEQKTREWFSKLEQSASMISLASIEPAADAEKAEKKDFYEIVIKDHKFVPDTLRVPAGEKIKLIVDNQDTTPEEFESHDFNREKIIAGNSKATIFIGPLSAGSYKYFGEFNEATAQGVIIAE